MSLPTLHENRLDLLPESRSRDHVSVCRWGGRRMRKGKFGEERIVGVPKQACAGWA